MPSSRPGCGPRPCPAAVRRRHAPGRPPCARRDPRRDQASRRNGAHGARRWRERVLSPSFPQGVSRGANPRQDSESGVGCAEFQKNAGAKIVEWTWPTATSHLDGGRSHGLCLNQVGESGEDGALAQSVALPVPTHPKTSPKAPVTPHKETAVAASAYFPWPTSRNHPGVVDEAARSGGRGAPSVPGQFWSAWTVFKGMIP